MPTNIRPIDSKWVFKKKRGGKIIARLFAQGNNKFTGVDFTNN